MKAGDKVRATKPICTDGGLMIMSPGNDYTIKEVKRYKSGKIAYVTIEEIKGAWSEDCFTRQEVQR